MSGDKLNEHLARKLPAPERLTARGARHFIDIARAALSVRQRETEAVTYPNSNEVIHFALDGGVDVVIYGMAPSRRLPIESFFGFLAGRNGVPVAYGGAFIYREQLDIGLNIFSEYRGGESEFLFAQILRSFCQYFDTRQVVIDSAQFGYGRRGGIASGAFWFYYKLGFRPLDQSLAKLAAAEWGKKRADASYRTPAATLRKFTDSNLFCVRGGGAFTASPSLADVALSISRHVATHYHGDRRAAHAAAVRRVNRLLGVGSTRSWPAPEQLAYRRMSQLVALVPDLELWPASAQQSLVALMRAKGGPRERRYVHSLRRHKRFAKALSKLAGGAPPP